MAGHPTTRRRLRVAVDLLVTSAVLMLGLIALLWLLCLVVPLQEAVFVKTLAGGAIGVAALLALSARYLDAERFGAANRVTLARAALVVLLAALAGEAPLPWLVVVLVSLVLILDNVDGRLARKHGTASAFGARFDMETDALLLLVLSVVVWRYDKAGAWILLAGLMRYAFVAAAVVLPWLRAPLPPRRRRQAAFVTQTIILIVCVSPLFVPPYSDALAAIGLAILGWSFAVDVQYLARRQR